MTRWWARRVVTPLEAFVNVQASSGVVLLAAAALAIVVAASPWGYELEHLLEAPIGLRVGPWAVERSIHFLINDGLMTIFFFVVGLEIRREMHEGELASRERAVLPVAAALGGMLAPALLFLAIAGRHAEYRSAWGVPMATDIAFALGILALLGKRVPPALRVLLLALAIIDDIGGIVVIATFYSGPIHLAGVAIVVAGVLGILLFQWLGIRRETLYLVPGSFVWLGFERAGLHPAIAGVLVGLLTPARLWLGPAGLLRIVRRAAERVEHELASGVVGAVPPERLAKEAARIDLARREALAPAVRLQMTLHPWVAFGIMPLFALANAGVVLTSIGAPTSLGLGVVVGLVVGKPLGILAGCALALRLGAAKLPDGIGWRSLVVLGLVAGVGFTMALFVGELAFTEGANLEQLKAAVLCASAIAMTGALVGGRLLLRV